MLPLNPIEAVLLVGMFANFMTQYFHRD